MLQSGMSEQEALKPTVPRVLSYIKSLIKTVVEKYDIKEEKTHWSFYLWLRSGHRVLVRLYEPRKTKTKTKIETGIKNGSYHRYERKGGKYKISEILPLIKGPIHGKDRMVRLDGDVVKVSSKRLMTFSRHGVRCAQCGMEGLYFVKERHKKGSKRFHLNLYGRNEHGSEVLMTSDHIIPRSKNGSEGVQNRQTMCVVCNCKKGNDYSDADKRKGEYKPTE